MRAILESFRAPFTASPVEPILRAIPAVVYMAVVYLASAVPGTEFTITFDDRVAHFLEYFVLGVLLVFFAASLRQGSSRGSAAALLAFVACFALADEYHQSFVPAREASVKDWLFDMSGAAAAVLLLRVAVPGEGR